MNLSIAGDKKATFLLGGVMAFSMAAGLSFDAKSLKVSAAQFRHHRYSRINRPRMPEIDYGNRKSIIENSMGSATGTLPDLNTENEEFQAYILDLLKACIDDGADGFRFDAAKHIKKIKKFLDTDCIPVYNSKL